ncbi:hypothetical protein UA08_09281 [Talaromyces atroroseus]|uniref:Zn(2)-C6 fungal-type domain-containing protein n=1 Tax=Talaromyces atroroseus TaxID=1441469 RepID=A0A1Q5Q6I0_TALAT|nr:hypothetical protein UA08_09281 [Talaromyces atroroseus]OKL55458.1 hypothetical protein UA08_09281 [Talaromyces atroroseus]
MPRPKVRPEDRLRAPRACLACKASKIRCDAQRPCASCVRRKHPDACVYSGVDGRRRRTFSRADSQAQSPGFSDEHPTPREQGANLPSPSSRHRSSRKVYVGETSSLSFLHFLRKTVKSYVGSVSFTDSERRHVVLETEIAQPADRTPPELTAEKIYDLLESYFEAVSRFSEGSHFVVYLFTAEEIDSLVADKSLMSMFTLESSSRREDSAALDLALAIGAQRRGEDSDLAMGYFCRARQIAFEDMLMGQSVRSVRLFLLLSFFMLGACHRNAASMFLGVAAKAAVILDLHNLESYGGLVEDEYWLRLRIWNSTRNFDILSSFILGRPRSLPTVPRNSVQPEIPLGKSLYSPQSAFRETVKLCSLFEDIMDTLNKDNILHVPTAENFLKRLRQWSQELPPSIRRFTPGVSSPQSCKDGGHGSDLSPSDWQLLIGNMHISCIYYFAVILITRPYLIAYLMSRLRGKAPDHLITDPDEASDVTIKNNKVSKLGQVCVSSAVYMVDMCQKVQNLTLTLGNLGLLKAWVFGAGLVLGFSMFAGEPRKDIEICFENARSVLASIATTSPQAELYHDILTSFSEAVTKYRRRVAGEVRRTVQHYMDQILILEQASLHINHEIQPNNSNQQFPGNMADKLETNSSSPPDPISDCTKGAHTLIQMASSLDTEYDDWEDLDMQFFDGFLPDPEPFDQLFHTVE